MAALLGYAFLFNLAAGSRGFYALDQSIAFDGAYRILQGQIPYLDFLIPCGPVTFWLHALFFKVFGINYGAFLVGASTINALATLCAIHLTRLFTSKNKLLSYVAGVITATWFYPPFGTPYYEQTANFFSLIAILCLSAAAINDQTVAGRRYVLGFLAGITAFLSIMSKQNVGVFIFPIYIVISVTGGRFRSKPTLPLLYSFSSGLILCALSFSAWILVVSDFGRFVEHVFVIPGSLGIHRLMDDPAANLVRLIIGDGPYANRFFSILLIVAFCRSAVVLLRHRGLRTAPTLRAFSAISLGACLAVYQNLFMISALNQKENSLAFTGILTAIAIYTYAVSPHSMQLTLPGFLLRGGAYRITRFALGFGFGLLALASTREGVTNSMNRSVQESVMTSTSFQPLQIEPLRFLKWGSPTRFHGQSVSAGNIEDLYRYLEAGGKPFFVYSRFTFFYGLLGTPSPQPLLWFHRGLTYGNEYSPDLDASIVDGLIRSGVETIVVEDTNSAGIVPGEFPAFERFLDQHFELHQTFGIFRIYEKER